MLSLNQCNSCLLVRGDTNMTSTLSRGGEGGGGKAKDVIECRDWGLASVLGVQFLFFY